MSEVDLHVDSQALERYEGEGNQLAIRTLDDIKRVSLIFVKSGMFKADRHADEQTKMYQAGVKIIAGVEFGIQPFAAMRGINIINGNAEMSANLMAAKVKAHPKYEYRVKKWDNEGCELTFFEIPRPGAPRAEWDELGPSSFTAEDAKTAGLANGDNWRKFARNMYFARAISNGVRIHCPDIFYGAPVYTEGEISGEFDAQPEPSSPEATAPAIAERSEPVDAEIIEDDAEPVVTHEVEEPAKEKAADPEAQDEPDLTEAKYRIKQGLADLGRNSVQMKAFIRSVLGKSSIDTQGEADDVEEAIRIEKEEADEQAHQS